VVYKFTKNPEKRTLPRMEAMAKWMKKNLFSTKANTVLSLFLIAGLIKIFTPIFTWLFVDATWIGDAAACREGSGACLAFINEKFTYIIFGPYPREEVWRPALTMFLMFALLWWSKEPSRWSKKLIKWWAGFVILGWILMSGGLGLAPVKSTSWGGLPLTLVLSFVGIFISYPFGIALALGRRSQMPFIKSICVIYIELIRGVPMISLLFMSSVMFPLFLPEGVSIDKLLRAQVAIIMFISAYMAEVVRGGLAAIPKGQYEAADALGLNYFQTMRFIILPQALKIVIPPSVNTAIGMLKDTSLVIIIALFDLLSTTKASLKDPEWLGFSVEGYLFAAFIYFILCFSMGKYARRLEVEFHRGHKNREVQI
tara:strand:- start:61621 stop:62727 length:1107 start_codon:yes stop_codon:yes gene_type:complete